MHKFPHELWNIVRLRILGGEIFLENLESDSRQNRLVPCLTSEIKKLAIAFKNFYKYQRLNLPKKVLSYSILCINLRYFVKACLGEQNKVLNSIFNP